MIIGQYFLVCFDNESNTTGFPWSWKIIENPGKIDFPGKSWKIDKNLKVRENQNFGKIIKEQNL